MKVCAISLVCVIGLVQGHPFPPANINDIVPVKVRYIPRIFIFLLS